MKKDSELSNQFRDQMTKSRDELCDTVFGKSYDNISSSELHKFTEELISSMYILRKDVPFNFNQIARLVVEHPNANALDRNVR